MDTIKLSPCILIIFLSGCITTGNIARLASAPVFYSLGDVVAENREINNLPPAERCERIHVDKREDCRKSVNKELNELTEAMSNKN